MIHCVLLFSFIKLRKKQKAEKAGETIVYSGTAIACQTDMTTINELHALEIDNQLQINELTK